MIKYKILLANMRHMNAAMHTLLHTNLEDDILVVQEPWFGRIRVMRSDSNKEGKDTLGGTAHPEWTVCYPYHTHDKCVKVITYTCKFSWMHNNRLTTIHTVPRLDLVQHPTILITDHYIGPHPSILLMFTTIPKIVCPYTPYLSWTLIPHSLPYLSETSTSTPTAGCPLTSTHPCMPVTLSCGLQPKCLTSSPHQGTSQEEASMWNNQVLLCLDKTSA